MKRKILLIIIDIILMIILGMVHLQEENQYNIKVEESEYTNISTNINNESTDRIEDNNINISSQGDGSGEANYIQRNMIKIKIIITIIFEILTINCIINFFYYIKQKEKGKSIINFIFAAICFIIQNFLNIIKHF